MGQSTSSPQQAPAAAPPAAQGGCPVKHEAPAQTRSTSSDGCPVNHGQDNEAQAGCPVDHGQTKQEQGGCPVKHSGGGGATGQQYNVYAQPIDPTNQMPFNPNQLPAPGQKKALSTDRVQSFIPKGGTDNETWQYPSPQMFYNALKRKGKGEDVDEDEVETIVAVHNNMNERAWNLVLNWERGLHKDDFTAANGVRLSRFMGRPDDISPMAWFKSTFMGYPKPFDRHDWVIDRNGKEVRYIIDFYFDEDANRGDERPSLHDAQSVKSIRMDARPALDSLESVFDRVREPVLRQLGKLDDVALGFTTVSSKDKDASDAGASEAAAAEPTSFDKLGMDEFRSFSQEIGKRCSSCFAKVNSCSTESECQRASVELTHCMASLVCPAEAKAYNKDVTSETAFDNMVNCMSRFEEVALKLREQALKEQPPPQPQQEK